MKYEGSPIDLPHHSDTILFNNQQSQARRYIFRGSDSFEKGRAFRTNEDVSKNSVTNPQLKSRRKGGNVRHLESEKSFMPLILAKTLLRPFCMPSIWQKSMMQELPF
jgi:hypothetical protein